jgi:hypothetical protein
VPTPDLTLSECSNVKASDDTKVVVSPFQCFMQISALIEVGVYDGSIRQDNLMVNDIVTGQTISTLGKRQTP